MKKVKVFILDDSASIRVGLLQKLNRMPDIEVVATAPNPYDARDNIVLKNPDVIILDIEMPRMDGITFLKKLMNHFPKPVVVLSSLTTKGSKIALQALEAGAIDVISKSTPIVASREADLFMEDLHDRIIAAAGANLKAKAADEKIAEYKDLDFSGSDNLITIGASTGGTTAVKDVLQRLPEQSPPILIVQHILPNFTDAFAQRLNEFCSMYVKEAADGEPINPGIAYVAPGNRHMAIEKKKLKYYISLSTGPKVNFQRPAIDILFKSAARILKNRTIGILLTGMGRDGASGLLEIKQNKGTTIAQDKNSCVVYGMPQEAVKLKAVDYQCDLFDIPEKIINILKTEKLE